MLGNFLIGPRGVAMVSVLVAFLVQADRPSGIAAAVSMGVTLALTLA